MAVKPVVDGIEREFPGTLKVIRLNVQDPVGRELGDRFGFQFTPTFVLLGPDGTERWRSVYSIDSKTLQSLLASSP
jgi:hypothetical protein